MFLVMYTVIPLGLQKKLDGDGSADNKVKCLDDVS